VVEAGEILDSELPALRDIDGDGTADWEYRTFRLNVPFSDLAGGFLRTGVSSAP
jgi:hypothetical protein